MVVEICVAAAGWRQRFEAEETNGQSVAVSLRLFGDGRFSTWNDLVREAESVDWCTY